MVIKKFLFVVVILSYGLTGAMAQESKDFHEIKEQLDQATKSLEQQQKVIEELRKRLEKLESHEPHEPHLTQPPHGDSPDHNDHPEHLEHPKHPAHGHGDSHEQDHAHALGVADPDHPGLIRVGSKDRYIDVSLNGLFAVGGSTAEDVEELQPGGHDPNQRGFTVQNVEAVLAGVIDPYFRAQGNLIFFIDSEGETTVELEEAYFETLSLPAGLQLKGGQYFTEFGRHNPTHPHLWPTVDQPLVAARFFGPDGLRNPGARLSWEMPAPFQSELFLSLQDSHGETAESFRSDKEGEIFLGRLHDTGRVSSLGDLLFVPRYELSFKPTEAQTILAGASAAFGPNASGQDTDTQIYGLDFFWKWVSPEADHGFPFVSWQTEALLRNYEAGAFSEDFDGDLVIDIDVDEDGILDTVPNETLRDYGFYSMISYGFRKHWIAGLRGGYVARKDRAEYEREFGDDPARADRWRLSPSLTYFPSHYSRVRLQYNYDHRDDMGEDHSVWLQFEFLLGSHGEHDL